MTDAGNISLRAVLIFIQVYDAQNFSAVARREGVAASQVSRAIHQLEDALGQQLFYRNTRAVIPTESGHLFIRYARAMAGNLEEARRELDERALEPTGPIRINCPVFFGQRHVAPGLAGLSARYPRLSVELTLTDDFVYRGSSGPNRWLMRRPGEAWVHYPVAPLMTSNNAETLLVAALGGMGIVLFPDWLVSERLKSGELVSLLPEHECGINTEPQTLAAIYPHTRHPPLNVRAVIDYYVALFGTPLYWQA